MPKGGQQTKHIFITGGVVSSLGKGLTAASIALLLKRRGYSVKLQKFDPYINVDPGTMSPYQHGEVYVTADGAETDLDLGHYERFTDIECTQASNFTTGRIYSNVIKRERDGGYMGGTVQVIPHITDEIKKSIQAVESEDVDIVITEIGGTSGDIESLPFLEAIRQYRQEIGRKNGLFIHMTLVPYLRAAGELKTKPSQQSVSLLRSIGIFPDIIICRSEVELGKEHRDKISLFCNVDKELVIEEKDVENSIYEVPRELKKQKLDIHCLKQLDLQVKPLNMSDWGTMLNRLIHPCNGQVKIGIVGKYISLQDAYKSVYESLTHGGIAQNVKVVLHMVESEKIEECGPEALLRGCDGILIPGGFGDRGIEGKIMAAGFARKHMVPFLGICLGMHCAVIEFARECCGFENANSEEFDPSCADKVIQLMKGQQNVKKQGGSMRLGSKVCKILPDTQAYRIYGKECIEERHRHRFEFNNEYKKIMEENGMIISGVSSDFIAEIIEIPSHKWYIACQFHPEYQSTPLKANPLFKEFIGASLDFSINEKEEEKYAMV
ncbi:CTP synthase [Chitinispirillales bacterium ANBcel5]|uniref:CTP synthase n=1 Tax=Cellulosispirillum alkaliphilum TaxID=3039283 RepID=UPI002A517392|nr:CTP synthase [Chitinispirillales bacterium ANBcel5]